MVTINTEREAQRALHELQMKMELAKYAAHDVWHVYTYSLPALSIKLIGPYGRRVDAIAVVSGWHVNGTDGDDLAGLMDAAVALGGREGRML